jgi:hypothetical protein
VGIRRVAGVRGHEACASAYAVFLPFVRLANRVSRAAWTWLDEQRGACAGQY